MRFRPAAVRELRDAVAGRRRAAADVAREYLERLRSAEGDVGSFITVDEADVIAQVGPRARSSGQAARGGASQIALQQRALCAACGACCVLHCMRLLQKPRMCACVLEPAAGAVA